MCVECFEFQVCIFGYSLQADYIMDFDTFGALITQESLE